MTILIHFHQSHYRNFKQYYLQHVSLHLRSEFPHLPSYSRFVEWTSLCLLPLVIYLVLHLGPCTGISFVDSTKISVCHNRRISQHKTFQGLALGARPLLTGSMALNFTCYSMTEINSSGFN